MLLVANHAQLMSCMALHFKLTYLITVVFPCAQVEILSENVSEIVEFQKKFLKSLEVSCNPYTLMLYSLNDSVFQCISFFS